MCHTRPSCGPPAQADDPYSLSMVNPEDILSSSGAPTHTLMWSKTQGGGIFPPLHIGPGLEQRLTTQGPQLPEENPLHGQS